MEMIRIQEQKWNENYTRCLIVSLSSSLQIGIYDKPQWFGSRAVIYALYTDEGQRRHGAAEYIMATAEDFLRQKGFDKVSIEFDPSVSDNFVKEWYHRMGYKDFTYSEDNLIMVKKL